MQCTNNLKQFGLGIHNFHDTQKGLPPLCVGNYDKVSFFYLICPYIEQPSLYDKITAIGIDQDFSSAWFDTLTPEDKAVYSSIPVFCCPTRRKAPQFSEQSASDGGCANGPRADYTLVAIATDRWKTGSFGDIRGIFTNTNNQQDHTSAIRTAKLKVSGDYKTWMSRDTMSRFKDGTSNTIVLGEKHIPAAKLNVCKSPSDDSAMDAWDCGILAPLGSTPSNHAGAYNVVRWIGSFQTGIARSATEDDDATTTTLNLWDGGAGFGSYHPGICLFLIGDGSVHTFPVTVSRDNVLYRLADVRDGESVSLP